MLQGTRGTGFRKQELQATGNGRFRLHGTGGKAVVNRRDRLYGTRVEAAGDRKWLHRTGCMRLQGTGSGCIEQDV